MWAHGLGCDDGQYASSHARPQKGREIAKKEKRQKRKSERTRERARGEGEGGGEREMPDVEGFQGRELMSNRVPRECPQPHIRCLHEEFTHVGEYVNVHLHECTILIQIEQREIGVLYYYTTILPHTTTTTRLLLLLLLLHTPHLILIKIERRETGQRTRGQSQQQPVHCPPSLNPPIRPLRSVARDETERLQARRPVEALKQSVGAKGAGAEAERDKVGAEGGSDASR